MEIAVYLFGIGVMIVFFYFMLIDTSVHKNY